MAIVYQSDEKDAHIVRPGDHVREALSTVEELFSILSIDSKLIPCELQTTAAFSRAWEVVEEHVGVNEKVIPTSVNWHMTRVCNYSCKFCFHTSISSFFLPQTPQGMQEAKGCLVKLRAAGMKKLNFSGGEPFTYSKELGELCRFCKQSLRLESVSIVSNGSMIRKKWFQSYGEFLDILAISCDSFDEETNKKIGRGKGMHLSQLKKVRQWCVEYGVPFKINSVINVHNVDEDMCGAIMELKPIRWKVFQCLLISGENAGENALRDARSLVITDDQFRGFLQRHEGVPCIVPEDNLRMKDSYLILDEELRFLNCTSGAKKPSESIREVPVGQALQEAGFDTRTFIERGGVYTWRKEDLVPDDIEELANTPSNKQPAPVERRQDIGVNRCAVWVGLALIAAVIVVRSTCVSRR
jgi:radical S-adenosyl methionine domain-containing protein 2